MGNNRDQGKLQRELAARDYFTAASHQYRATVPLGLDVSRMRVVLYYIFSLVIVGPLSFSAALQVFYNHQFEKHFGIAAARKNLPPEFLAFAWKETKLPCLC